MSGSGPLISALQLIIERAGQPVAAIVPLSDLPDLDRDTRIRRRLAAGEEIRRLARAYPVPDSPDGATIIRRQRDERAQRLMGVLDEHRRSQE